jgi:hypothetical protein
VKYYSLLAVCAAALAQSTTTTFTSGETATTTVSTDHTQTVLTRSINGREIPLEKTETRLLSKSENGSVIETIVRRYDRNGQLTSTERTVSEVRNRPNGLTTKSTTYTTDINGVLRETERRTIDTEKQGDTARTETVIERPVINGGLQTVEKRSAVIENRAEATHQDETVYRRGSNGDFSVALRKIADTTRKDNTTTEVTDLYEPIGEVNRLQLSRQQVTTTVAQPDGSETRQVDYYLPALPGVAGAAGESPKLWEQDTVQRKKQSDGGVVETVTARRADPNHPNQLGPAQQVSETVCRGNCSSQ